MQLLCSLEKVAADSRVSSPNVSGLPEVLLERLWNDSFSLALIAQISLVATRALFWTPFVVSWDLCCFNRLFREQNRFTVQEKKPTQAKTSQLSKHWLYKIQKVWQPCCFSLSRQWFLRDSRRRRGWCLKRLDTSHRWRLETCLFAG